MSQEKTQGGQQESIQVQATSQKPATTLADIFKAIKELCEQDCGNELYPLW
jgi:hypothetical protein